MNIKDLFEKWKLCGLKVRTTALEMEWTPKDADKDAAWELYVEVLTRVTTQALSLEEGTEEAALSSIYSLFETTRHVLKSHGRDCIAFSKVAIVVLNQVVRPFTSEWYPVFQTVSVAPEQRKAFRAELRKLQRRLISYSHILAEIADVEDITELESP